MIAPNFLHANARPRLAQVEKSRDKAPKEKTCEHRSSGKAQLGIGKVMVHEPAMKYSRDLAKVLLYWELSCL